MHIACIFIWLLQKKKQRNQCNVAFIDMTQWGSLFADLSTEWETLLVTYLINWFRCFTLIHLIDLSTIYSSLTNNMHLSYVNGCAIILYVQIKNGDIEQDSNDVISRFKLLIGFQILLLRPAKKLTLYISQLQREYQLKKSFNLLAVTTCNNIYIYIVIQFFESKHPFFFHVCVYLSTWTNHVRADIPSLMPWH